MFVGRAPAANWLQFQADTGGFNVKVELDDRSPMRPMGQSVTRKLWRFRVQGPNAWQVLEKVNGGPIEDVKFFRMSTMRVAGRRDETLRHGMAGAPGLELWGPYETYDEVRETLIEAGKELRPRAGRVAGVLAVEHARVGMDPVSAARDLHGRGAAAVPGVADVVELRGRQRAGGQLRVGRHRGLLPEPVRARDQARSCDSTTTSTDGRVLEKIDPETQRRKVTLAWSSDDVRRSSVRLRLEGEDYMPFDIPNANYGSSNFDAVLDEDDNVVGLSLFTGYSANERARALARDRRPGDRDRRRAAGRLGRARRRVAEVDRGAPPAEGRPRDREPGAVRGGRANVVRGRRLARRGGRELSDGTPRGRARPRQPRRRRSGRRGSGATLRSRARCVARRRAPRDTPLRPPSRRAAARRASPSPRGGARVAARRSRPRSPGGASRPRRALRPLDALEHRGGEPLHEHAPKELQARSVARLVTDHLDRHPEGADERREAPAPPPTQAPASRPPSGNRRRGARRPRSPRPSVRSRRPPRASARARSCSGRRRAARRRASARCSPRRRLHALPSSG